MLSFAKLITLTLLLFSFASTAHAKCELDDLREGRTSFNIDEWGKESFECLEDKIVVLEESNAALKKQIEEFEERLSFVPSIYTFKDSEESDLGEPYNQGHFELSAPRHGQSAGQVIAQHVLLELCGDQDGCKLGLIKVNVAKGAAKGAISLDPCAFSYDGETGNWQLSAQCGGASGTDGNAKLPNPDNKDGQIIFEAGGQCAVAESGALRARDGAGKALTKRDRLLDLFLISGYAGGAEKDYICRLTLTD